MDETSRPDSPHAVWWNQMTPAAREDVQFRRHRGADDPQYQQHVRAFARKSFSEFDWGGHTVVKILHDRFGT